MITILPLYRFIPEEKAKRHPCAYLPFGYGPRNCIGMRLAVLEAKMALIEILSKFRIALAPETKASRINVTKLSISYKLLIPFSCKIMILFHCTACICSSPHLVMCNSFHVRTVLNCTDCLYTLYSWYKKQLQITHSLNSCYNNLRC